ncbi:MAG: hypothetical protein HOM55_01625 [Proteobacteria bacterium]|nr:hypothetical protein [Pseudomonadota bacterium]
MNPIPFPNIAAIEDAASRWVAAMDRDLSDNEKEMLEEWLQESPIHAETIVKMASIWDLMDVLSPISHLLPLDTPLEDIEDQLLGTTDRSTQQTVKSVPHTRLQYALVACLTVISFTAVWLFDIATNIDNGALQTNAVVRNDPALSSFSARYITGAGDYSEIELPDGSKLKLNTKSELLVEYTANQRLVTLKSGEAFFTVTKNLDQPFRVEAGNSSVTAIGTAFNVEIGVQSNVQIIVTEGKVMVDQINNFEVSEVLDLASNDPPPGNTQVYLEIGQKITIDRSGEHGPIALLTQEELDAPLAWQDGMILFEGETLAEAISEINRYTSKTFHITDPSISSIPVGGYFKANDTDQLLIMLERNFGIIANHNGDRIALFRR